ncbi:hypothetical protein ACIPIN_12775 [Pseudomonas sp. NPDC087697]|uniref:hypothetical protein n=1 Tax=Pseudomonas sp. NPDC087697 TaxID=3364447 RepID=UPI003826CC0F
MTFRSLIIAMVVLTAESAFADVAPQVMDALKVENACASAKVPTVDDGISDAGTVALALAMQCAKEYQGVTGAINTTLDNDAQRNMLTHQRMSKDQMQQEFLTVVMGYRQWKKTHPDQPSKQ